MAGLCGAAVAPAGIVGKEFAPADWRARGVSKVRIENSLFTGTRRRTQSQQDGNNRQSLALSPEPEHLWPPISCWGHVSHKGFARLLSMPSTIEANTSKTRG